MVQNSKKKLDLIFSNEWIELLQRANKDKKLVMLRAILDIWGAIKTDMGYQVNKQVLC